MPGEIRDALSRLKDARAKMIADLTAEVDDVVASVQKTHADGIEAMKLPRAELDAYRSEIQQIRSEFAGLTNGPPGPLADTSQAVAPGQTVVITNSGAVIPDGYSAPTVEAGGQTWATAGRSMR